MRQRLIDLGCPAGKLEIQPIAVDADAIAFRPRSPGTNGRIVVMFAGRFCEKKGLLYALEAIRKVRCKGCPVEFRMIGDGPLVTSVRSFVREGNIEDSVRLLGFLDHADYLREMNRADIFLHPSTTASNGDSEGGAPTTILEAQASGMPIISTYHADIPNVVVPGKSALLVAERDSDALARSLEYLIDNPSVWAEMGRAGRAHVKAHHDIKRQVLSLEDKYLAFLR